MCDLSHWLGPAANPYRIEHTFVLVFLVGSFALWRHVKPRPDDILRVFLIVAAGSTFLISSLMSFNGTARGTFATLYGFIGKASVFIALCLLVEVGQEMRRRVGLPRAWCRRR